VVLLYTTVKLTHWAIKSKLILFITKYAAFSRGADDRLLGSTHD
jgi:hypothetical protein